MSRRVVLSAAGSAILALGAVVGWALLGGEESAAAETTGATPRSTVRIERRDLIRRESLDGTLAYADARSLTASGPGTLTRLPAEGSVVRRGGVLYEADGKSVRLLYGVRPAWRPLSRASSNGADVRQLEANLVALGYDPDGDIEVDDDFDWATEAAVERWEDERGAAKDGVVDRGEVVFLPGARRIGQHETAVGSTLQPGGSIAETTSTRRVVAVHLNATDQELVSRGDGVRVGLPDGRTVDGTVVRVGTVAKVEQGADGSEGTPYVEVEISLAGGAGALDQAPVDVDVESDRRDGVLVVPVSALLAVTGGGYAVETTDGRLLAVETGLFADGYVEVSGEGVRARLAVVVAS